MYHIFVTLQAESNVKKVLVSDPKDGVSSFGLVDKGRQQAKEVSSLIVTFIFYEYSQAPPTLLPRLHPLLPPEINV